MERAECPAPRSHVGAEQAGKQHQDPGSQAPVGGAPAHVAAPCLTAASSMPKRRARSRLEARTAWELWWECMPLVSRRRQRDLAGASVRDGRACAPSGRRSAPGTQCRCGPRRTCVAQTGLPCHSHSLDQGKSDQTPAGLLARGSSHDARPSRASHVAASDPVAAGSPWSIGSVHRARRLQLQGQPRNRRADPSHRVPY